MPLRYEKQLQRHAKWLQRDTKQPQKMKNNCDEMRGDYKGTQRNSKDVNNSKEMQNDYEKTTWPQINEKQL